MVMAVKGCFVLGILLVSCGEGFDSRPSSDSTHSQSERDSDRIAAEIKSLRQSATRHILSGDQAAGLTALRNALRLTSISDKKIRASLMSEIGTMYVSALCR